MMTEEEAKKKWCPFASSRVCSYATNGGVEWRIFVQEHGLDGKCLGAGCMAWIETSPQRKFNHANIPGRIVTEEAEGYCGLAVRP